MAPRAGVSQLPEDVRDELNRRLVASSFSGYGALAGWLLEKGFTISRSAVQRYGAKLEAEFDLAMADVRRARALAKAVRDEGDDGDMLAATSGILQDNLLRVAIALRTADSDPETAAKSISLVARAHADVGRMQLQLSKWREEQAEKAQEAAERCAQVARRGGLTPEAVDVIRREILGIAAP